MSVGGSVYGIRIGGSEYGTRVGGGSPVMKLGRFLSENWMDLSIFNFRFPRGNQKQERKCGEVGERGVRRRGRG